MINFRKLKQDFSPSILKEGKALYDKGVVLSAKVESLKEDALRLHFRITGNYDNTYCCTIEIDREKSTIVDSDCDCTYKYDCQHLAASLYYLEEHLNEIVVNFSKEADVEQLNKKDKEILLETAKEAEHKEVVRKGKKQLKELLQEYVGASDILGKSPFFLKDEEIEQERVELAVIFNTPDIPVKDPKTALEIRLALRLPFRSKPLNIASAKEFLDAVKYQEPLFLAGRKVLFKKDSFDPVSQELLKMVMNFCYFPETKPDRNLSIASIAPEDLGTILANSHKRQVSSGQFGKLGKDSGLSDPDQLPILPGLYLATIEEPLRFSLSPAVIQFQIDYIETEAPKIWLKPTLLAMDEIVELEGAGIFECAEPGMLIKNIYYRFQSNIRRRHLRALSQFRDVIIPEPLFGTFIENSLPELLNFAKILSRDVVEKIVTMPYVGELKATCDINYLNAELEASLNFVYDDLCIPASHSQLTVDQIQSFVSDDGIVARNLTEEMAILSDLFQDFYYDTTDGVYVAKTEKKIVEFMTEIIPRYQGKVKFNCPQNLLEQFIYDDTKFHLSLKETDRIDVYKVDLKTDGHLKNFTVDQLWDCIASKRTFIELINKNESKVKKGKGQQGAKTHKILVLDLEKLTPVIQIFDELGINSLGDHIEERPLWSLASISHDMFEKLPITFKMSKRLEEIQEQMLGKSEFATIPLPKEIKATLRGYQVRWCSVAKAASRNASQWHFSR